MNTVATKKRDRTKKRTFIELSLHITLKCIEKMLIISFFIIMYIIIWKFSGQSDEAAEEEYDENNYDNYEDAGPETIEVTPPNLSSLSTINEGTNDRITDEISETSTIPTATTTTATNLIDHTQSAIETTTGYYLKNIEEQ